MAEADAFEAALGALDRKERTAHELAAWLKGRGFGLDEIEAALRRLFETEVLDDERFARRYAEDKRELSGWGRGADPRGSRWRAASRSTRSRRSSRRIPTATSSTAPAEILDPPRAARSTTTPTGSARSSTSPAGATTTRSPTRRCEAPDAAHARVRATSSQARARPLARSAARDYDAWSDRRSRDDANDQLFHAFDDY